MQRPFHPRHLPGLRISPRRTRGSILVVSYFVILTLLALTIPQTMRSFSSMQLESRYVDTMKLGSATEAGLDDVIHYLWDNPTFGAPLPNWASWSPATSLPGLTAPYVVQVQNVKETPGMPPTYLKRIRVTGTSKMTNQAGSYEMLVQVEQQESTGVVQAGRRIVMGIGNATNRTTITADEVAVYNGGQLYPPGDPPGTDPLIDAKGGSRIYGHVRIQPPSGPLPPDSKLCCDAADLPYISLGWSSASLFASIRYTDSYGIEQDAATKQSGIVDSNSEYAPKWITGGGTFNPTPPAAQSPTCGNAGYREVATNETKVFCQEGDNNPACSVYLPVAVAADGTKEYCLDSLWVRGGGNSTSHGTAVFVGNKVRVYLKGSFPYNSVNYAMRSEPNSVIYGCPESSLMCGSTNPQSSDRTSSFSVNVHDGNSLDAKIRFAGHAEFYGSVNAPYNEIIFGSNAGDTIEAKIPGYFTADTLTLAGGAKLTITSGVGNPEFEKAKDVRVLGFRRCRLPDCSQ